MSEKWAVTQFPPEFILGNMNAMAISNFGVVAAASGSSIHLFSLKDKKLEKMYSFSPTASVVTTLAFHSALRLLLAGDGAGRFSVFDFSSVKVVISSQAMKEPAPICDLLWIGNAIVALRGNRTMSCYNFINDEAPQLSSTWAIQLPSLFTKLEFDSLTKNYILLYGHEKSFMIFKTGKVGDKQPEQIVFMDANGIIKDVKFHVHIPNYIFFVFDTEIHLFHIQTQKLVTLVQTSQTVSPFERIIQFRDHRKLWVKHFNGTIAHYSVNDPYCMRVVNNAAHPQMKQRMFNLLVDPLDDGIAIMLYHPFGLGVFDTNAFMLISVVSSCMNKNLCFDTDSKFYAIGTSKGFINIGDLTDKNKVMTFSVSDRDVTFVSVCYPVVNWATDNAVGSINTQTRQIIIFPQHHDPTRVIGSHKGGLLVQRRPEILGIFIDGKEKRIAFNSPVIDFCFHADESDASTGEFLVITDTREMYFIKYAGGEVQAPFLQLHAIEQMGNISRLTWSKYYVFTGSTNGLITKIDIRNPTPEFKQPFLAPISYLSFFDDTLFGMVGGNTVFVGLDGLKASGTFTQIVPISKSHFAFVSTTGHIRIVSINPQSLDPIADTPLNCITNYRGSSLGSDILDIIEGRDNLRMMFTAGACNSGLANDIVSFFDSQEMIDKWSLIRSYSFSSNTEQVLELLQSFDVNDPLYLFCTSLVITLLGFEKSVNEKQKEFLLQTATKMFQSNKNIEALTILTLCGEDSFAVSQLLAINQIQAALPMIRKRITDEEKQIYQFEIGCKLIEKGSVIDSIPFFASAKEYHALLFCLYSCDLLFDCYRILKYCQEKCLLIPLSEEKVTKMNVIIPLEELIKLIEDRYAKEFSSN